MRALTQTSEMTLNVNGEFRTIPVEPGALLLYTLRNGLGLTGAKPGCENGDCGACTVMVGPNPIKSCMMLTVEAQDQVITTIEGLHEDPLQKAFLTQWAFQCGYCTSGFLMNAKALSVNFPDADSNRITEWLRSNICRCTGYQEIRAAITEALAESSQIQPRG